MVDYATRYPEAVALKSIEAEKVAEALWTMWTRLGIPKEVLSDQGGQFTGAVMREVHRLLAVKGRTTTPYHAQCNGLVERFNGTLKAMIKKLCVEDPKTWDRFIPGVLFAYREVPQESTGFSPFELLYGRTVRGPMAILRDLWTKEGKMDKIAKMPRPTTKRQIRSFLGLAGFYRRFVPGFADIALPLTDATKKSQPNKVIWTKPMQVALDTLKVKLSTEPVCKLPDFSVPFTLRTDASGVGLGAMLLQDQGNGMQMVACASKKLLPAERNYSTIERECLAVVWGVRKFGPYLYGKPFCIQSDHKPLEYLEGLKATNKRLMRWALALQPYMYTIQAIPGRDNVGADLLSRSEE
ncbi:hypothetical protein V1264_025097 [Littorina saxatilis]